MTQCQSVRSQLTRPVLSAGRGDTVSQCVRSQLTRPVLSTEITIHNTSAMEYIVLSIPCRLYIPCLSPQKYISLIFQSSRLPMASTFTYTTPMYILTARLRNTVRTRSRSRSSSELPSTAARWQSPATKSCNKVQTERV